jgi:hypothetical protein
MEEIQSELNEIRRILNDVSYQMQELRKSIRGAPVTTQVLSMSEPYVHPWWQYQRLGSEPGRNNLGGSVQASGSVSADQTRLGISGKSKAA